MPDRPPPWRVLADLQDGIVSRGQLLDLGLSPARARRDVDNGRWRPLRPGVYAMFTGPVDPRALVWAAVLYAGAEAVASHRTALWLAGVLDEPADPIHVSVPATRRVVRQPGLRIHLSRPLADNPRAHLHPSAAPPRTRLEVALLDQCDAETHAGAVHLVLTAIQRRLTTADRVREALRARSRHTWRALLREVLAEADAGVASPLERRYRRGVELRHRLPAGLRNGPERAPDGARLYRDVRYAPWRVVVELDGREAHPASGAFRDLRRDNLAAVAGDTVLRYGWRDVAGRPCGVAAQVAYVLTERGWAGGAEPCAPGCAVRAVARGS